jgi:hypothetical protein
MVYVNAPNKEVGAATVTVELVAEVVTVCGVGFPVTV